MIHVGGEGKSSAFNELLRIVWMDGGFGSAQLAFQVGTPLTREIRDHRGGIWGLLPG